jgi:fatty-acyl-CoA synthase
VALNWLKQTPYSVVETRARIFPESVALLVPAAGGSEEIERITYGELERRAREAAGGLWATGVRAGTHLAIWADNSPAWVASWLGASLLGAVTVAINVRLTPREVGELIARNDVTHLLVAGRVIDSAVALVEAGGAPANVYALAAEGGANSPLPPLPSADAPYEAVPIAGRRVGLIQFTSGSTGLPKGVQLREGAVAAMGACCASRWLLSPGDRVYGAFSLAHNAGSTYTTMAAFSAGAAMVLPATGWARGEGIAIAERAGATVLPGVDTIVTDLLASDRPPSRLRAVVGGFDSTAARRITEELEVEVSNTYGLTEMTANVSVGDLRDRRQIRIERIGLPHPGLSARIVDPDGEELPPGQQGEIQTDGWAKMESYFQVPAGQQPFTADGWLETGDLGSIDERGYLSFLGRTKDVIRSGGENVAAFEIERFLESHQGVLQAAVVASPDDRFGEVPCAFVKLRPGVTLGAEELSSFCQGQLAVFKVPKYYEFVDEFPLVGINKVSKADLRARAAELAGARGDERA